MLAAGRISLREDKPPQLMCDQVWSLERLPEDPGELPPPEEEPPERGPAAVRTGNSRKTVRSTATIFFIVFLPFIIKLGPRIYADPTKGVCARLLFYGIK